MWSSPTPSARIKCSTRAKRYNGEFIILEKNESVRVIRKANLPTGNGLGDYDEKRFTAVYSRHGIVLVCAEDVENGIY